MRRGFDIKIIVRNERIIFEPTFSGFVETFSTILNFLRETINVFPRIETLLNETFDPNKKLLQVFSVLHLTFVITYNDQKLNFALTYLNLFLSNDSSLHKSLKS